MIVSQALRFGRRLAIPSKRQIIHEMRMLQADEERRRVPIPSVALVTDDEPVVQATCRPD